MYYLKRHVFCNDWYLDNLVKLTMAEVIVRVKWWQMLVQGCLGHHYSIFKTTLTRIIVSADRRQIMKAGNCKRLTLVYIYYWDWPWHLLDTTRIIVTYYERIKSVSVAYLTLELKNKTHCITHRIEVYPVATFIHPSNNLGPEVFFSRMYLRLVCIY